MSANTVKSGESNPYSLRNTETAFESLNTNKMYHDSKKSVAQSLTNLTPIQICINGIKYYFCNMMDVTEILNTIVDVYQCESVTVSELMEILSKCGFSREETREIIRYAINAKLMGRVSYRKMGKNMIGSNTVVVLKKKKNF
jgi:hypothetical protein